MKLGGSAMLMSGVWLVLSACSGRYDVGLEPSAGSAGSTSSVGNSASPGGGTSDAGGGGAVADPSGTSAAGDSMSVGAGGSSGPASTCGFAPSTPGGTVAPTISSEELAGRVYGFLEDSDAPTLALPVAPSASWVASLAKSILDAHFEAGTSVPGLERVLKGMVSSDGRAPTTAPGVWAAKLADPVATLSTLLAEPTSEPHRIGLLTDAAVLALHPDISPRGVWLVNKLFCQQVPLPPASIESVLPPPQDGVSKRQRLQVAIASPACASCHALFDPPAFSLEHFDSDGNYRELDNGVPVDSSGSLSQGGISFNDFEDLAPKLAQSCDVAHCFTSQVLSSISSLPQQIGFSDADTNQIANAFADSGYSVRALVEAIVTSRTFLH